MHSNCMKLTFALCGWAGPLKVGGGVEWAWPAWGLTPLRLVEALRTCYTIAHVALPIISGLAGNWKKMAFNMGLPPSSTTRSLLWQDELLRDRVYHSGLRNVHITYNNLNYLVQSVRACYTTAHVALPIISGLAGNWKKMAFNMGLLPSSTTCSFLWQDELLRDRVYHSGLKNVHSTYNNLNYLA